MKILILSDRIPPYNLGGAEVSTYRIAKALAQEKTCQVTLVTSHDKTISQEETFYTQDDKLNIISIYSKPYPKRLKNIFSLYNPLIIKKLKKVIKEENPHIIQVHNVSNYLSFYCLKLSTPLVFTAHDYLLICPTKFTCFLKLKDYRINPYLCIKCQRFRFLPFRRRSLKNFTKDCIVLTISQLQRKILSINGINIHQTIYNGIDPLTFQPKDEYTQNLKSKLKLKDKKIILFVGRLSYYKGWTFLIHALKEVKKEIKDIVLLIASGYNKEVERFAQDLSIEIKFTGWLSWEMMPNVYNLADLTVVPSIYPDPAPATLFEAMAVKKPIIASIYGGANEIIKDEYTGLLVNPYNTEELAFGIKTLIRDERLCQKLKEAGFKRLNEKFHIKINVKKRLQLYQELICKN